MKRSYAWEHFLLQSAAILLGYRLFEVYVLKHGATIGWFMTAFAVAFTAYICFGRKRDNGECH